MVAPAPPRKRCPSWLSIWIWKFALRRYGDTGQGSPTEWLALSLAKEVHIGSAGRERVKRFPVVDRPALDRLRVRVALRDGPLDVLHGDVVAQAEEGLHRRPQPSKAA